jgi:hypothetical protein
VEETTEQPTNRKSKNTETVGAFIVTLILSILVPILSLWNGIEYLVGKQVWKGSLLLAIFAIQLIIIVNIV